MARKVKVSGESVTVALKNGGTRVFSVEDHGENFAELAQEFCETNGATIVEESAE